MVRGLLPEHIGPLVDRLRSGDHQAVSLPDVAALTEVLMRSLESYFKSIDLTIYEECQSLADYIDDARQEISSLSPDQDSEVGTTRAGLELEAIVQQTESATNTIMGSAERIMEADPNDMEAYTATVNDAVMQIFEACSFQDITGQRISKVVSTLEHVEDRVGRLINILGVMEGSKKTSSEPEPEIDADKALLNGPALDGEGIDQTEIDALLNADGGGFDSVITDDVEIEDLEIDDIEFDAVEPDDSTAEESRAPEMNGVAHTPEPNSIPTAEAPTKPNGTVSADDIDFMFDGQGDMAPEEQPKAVEAPKPAEAEAPEPVEAEAPNLIEQAKQKKAAALAAKSAQRPAAAAPVTYEEGPKAALNPKSSGSTSQTDIDALFS